MELVGSLLIVAAAVHAVALGALAGPAKSTRRRVWLVLWCVCAAGFGFAVSTRMASPAIAAVSAARGDRGVRRLRARSPR